MIKLWLLDCRCTQTHKHYTHTWIAARAVEMFSSLSDVTCSWHNATLTCTVNKQEGWMHVIVIYTKSAAVVCLPPETQRTLSGCAVSAADEPAAAVALMALQSSLAGLVQRFAINGSA